MCEGEGEGEGRSETVEKHLKTLGRLFKCLENVSETYMYMYSYIVAALPSLRVHVVFESQVASASWLFSTAV